MRAERCALLLFFWVSTTWARIGHEHEEVQPQPQQQTQPDLQQQPEDRPRNRRIQKANGNKIKDQYMVRISKTSELAAVTDAIVFMNPFCSILYTYLHVFEGFCVTQIPEEFMEMFMVLNEFDIMEVEEDKEQATFQNSGEVVWGLDRIDQVSLPLDGTFRGRGAQTYTGQGVDIYVVDVRRTRKNISTMFIFVILLCLSLIRVLTLFFQHVLFPCLTLDWSSGITFGI
jgi:hypothetical protein